MTLFHNHAPHRRGGTRAARSDPERRGIGRLLRVITALVTAVSAALVGAPVASAATNQRPLARFTISPQEGLTAGSLFTLDGSSSTDPDGDRLTYAWRITGVADNIQDSYTGKTVTVGVSTNGPVKISLTVKDPSGASSSASDEIYLNFDNWPPQALFTVSPADVAPFGTQMTFDGTVSSDPDGDELTYKWYLTDGGDYFFAGNSAVLQYTFATKGLHNVKLVVTDPNGASNEAFGGALMAGPDPVAKIVQSPNPTTIAPGTTVIFDGSSSIGENFRYDWNAWRDGPPWNDGSSSEGKESTFSVTYDKVGTYHVSLFIEDRYRRRSKQTIDLTVAEPSEPPVASFKQAPASPVTPDTKVTFDGSASTGNGLTYAWYVRDENGVVGTDKILNYTFKKAGSYGVELRVTDTDGRTARKWTGYEVTATSEPPVASFTQAPTSPVTSNTKVTFDGSASTGDGLTYAWYVRGENGVVGTNKILNYTFKKAGSYGVELRVTDTDGRTARKWTGYEVTATNQPPVASFTQTPASTTLRAGTAVTFDGTPSTDPDGDKLTYAWYVRGEKRVVTTDKTLNYTFKKTGKYGVELRVTDPTGAVAKKWIELVVTG